MSTYYYDLKKPLEPNRSGSEPGALCHQAMG